MSTLRPLQKPVPKNARRRTVGKPAPTNRRSLGIFVALLGVVALVIVVLVVRGRANQAIAPSNVSVEQAVRPLNAPTGQTAEGYWYKGRPDAPVTVVVYGDFQCPACQSAFRQLEGVLDQAYVESGKVKFVFHDFPLSIHPNAVPAAQAARAAGAQGKFWAMHDLLYARQGEWEGDRDVTKRFKSYAAELGLDQAAFDRALDEKTYAQAITAAIGEGEKQGVNSTPTYLVDGKVTSANELLAAISAAIQAKGG